MRYSEEDRYQTIDFCISYLINYSHNERGIFRTTVSQTDVRLLQPKILEQGASLKSRDDLDPHVVAELLLSSFKELKSPLFHEVYDDILATGRFRFQVLIFLL